MYTEIDTPSVLIDTKIAKGNIKKYQTYCTEQGLNLRPHIKTHKLPYFASLQIEAGAVGITCQKVSEAEAMLDGDLGHSIKNILLSYNILGRSKLERLKRISERVKLSVVADNMECIEGLSKAFSNLNNELPILIEVDTGALRCGVVTPQEACDLALRVSELPGVSFAGLMTYPPKSNSAMTMNNFFNEAKHLIELSGLKIQTISIGGSPQMWKAHEVPLATEYRVGTYIYNDKSLIVSGACTIEDCALTILSTVISTPTPNRAVIDAGSKVLTSDLMGLKGHGLIVGYPDLTISQLSEEHGCITSSTPTNLRVGQRIQVIPNHACVVSNMVDHVVFIKDDQVLTQQQVVARGKVW